MRCSIFSKLTKISLRQQKNEIMSLPGGLSEAHEATPETQALVDQVRLIV